MNSSSDPLGKIFALIFVLLIAIFIGVAGGALALQMVDRNNTAAALQPGVQTVEVTREVIIEREVTREVIIENAVEVPVEVTREVEVQVPAAEAEATAEADPGADIVLPEGATPEDLQLFFEVWDTIKRDFDGDLPANQDLNYAVIEGAIATLNDEYTRFLEPDVAARMREDMDGSFEGIGAFVRETEEGLIEIVRPMDGQPADLAGVRAGDIIVTVDGEDITGQGIDEVITKVRGPRDTTVTLGLSREGSEELIEVSIVRARIEIPVVEYRMLDDDIAYIHLTTFNTIAYDKVREAFDDLMAQNPRALIFDLRDNPGGFLDVSVEIADLFLPQGVVLYEKNRNGLDRAFNSDSGDAGEEIPMVVLINAGSASASELVAGAFQDNGRAPLIGEQSFGKGSVQQLRVLSDGSELRVTIARWYTPNNKNINGEGVAPDIVVELDPEAEIGGEDDAQLQRAIEYILKGR